MIKISRTEQRSTLNRNKQNCQSCKLLLVFFLFNGFIHVAAQDSAYFQFDEKNRIIIEGFLNKKGETNGKWISYEYLGDRKVTIKVAYFKNGFYDGPYLEYHLNGSLKIKGQYKKNIFEKKTQTINGEIVGEYLANLPVGKWFFYDDNGNLIFIKKYNRKGKLKKELKCNS